MLWIIVMSRSNQLIMYFIAILLIVLVLGTIAVWMGQLEFDYSNSR